jgi:excisionase family DNA binding protein
MSDTSKLLTPKEAAAVLSVGLTTLYSITAPRGNLPFVRVGTRGVRYHPDTLARWIKAQEGQSAAQQAA